VSRPRQTSVSARSHIVPLTSVRYVIISSLTINILTITTVCSFLNHETVWV